MLVGLEEFTFAPQNRVQLVAQAPSVDLQSHNVDGQTAFVWKNAEGNVLVQGTDYEINDGRTRFLDPVIGQKVYCEMTNVFVKPKDPRELAHLGLARNRTFKKGFGEATLTLILHL